ncbi:hypothetical protein RhiirA5_418433 [Rhizophagus irregularis]|uniref:Uncharacterized protein n=1 Tax=Rhizophagus irregularis TaxID=588596 RepID=A0A2N0PKC4_9GLOM|nr:hypothetical protein RhiirA5_418433 [Rhizophagus irregularis]
MRRLMFDKQIKNIISSGIEVKGLELLNNSQISGKEGEFLKLRFLVEGLDNDIIIRVKINQFRRCQISSEVFGSSLSLRYVKSLYILAKFITDDEDVDTYPGQIQYYFTHVVDFLDGPVKHFLAYVRWYKHANSTNIRYYFSSDEICNVELWNTEFYPISRDCIIPVHHILGRFVPSGYESSSTVETHNVFPDTDYTPSRPTGGYPTITSSISNKFGNMLGLGHRQQ